MLRINPCPRCKGQTLFVRRKHGKYLWRVSVGCDDPGCAGIKPGVGWGMAESVAMIRAIQDWNRRTS